jgi:hypothetical protein
MKATTANPMKPVMKMLWNSFASPPDNPDSEADVDVSAIVYLLVI